MSVQQVQDISEVESTPVMADKRESQSRGPIRRTGFRHWRRRLEHRGNNGRHELGYVTFGREGTC